MQKLLEKTHACAVVGEEPTKSQTEIGLQIINADFGFIHRYLLYKNILPADQVGEAIAEYKKFMMVIGAAGKSQVAMISPLIDEVWHAHILHLSSYVQFCLDTFGHLIDHKPCGPDFCLSPAAPTKFLELYETMFGDLPPIWLGDPDDEPPCGPICTDDHPPCMGG